jgi:hypothetical protein
MCLGYSTADTGSLVGMAWATGPMKEVVNIGLDVMKFSIPRNTTVTDFFESVKHKVSGFVQWFWSGDWLAPLATLFPWFGFSC